jgi:hypothetical protein
MQAAEQDRLRQIVTIVAISNYSCASGFCEVAVAMCVGPVGVDPVMPKNPRNEPRHGARLDPESRAHGIGA